MHIELRKIYNYHIRKYGQRILFGDWDKGGIERIKNGKTMTNDGWHSLTMNSLICNTFDSTLIAIICIQIDVCELFPYDILSLYAILSLIMIHTFELPSIFSHNKITNRTQFAFMTRNSIKWMHSCCKITIIFARISQFLCYVHSISFTV